MGKTKLSIEMHPPPIHFDHPMRLPISNTVGRVNPRRRASKRSWKTSTTFYPSEEQVGDG